MRAWNFDLAVAIAVVGFLAYGIVMGARGLEADRQECLSRGGVQMETGNGRVCVSRDVLLKPRGG